MNEPTAAATAPENPHIARVVAALREKKGIDIVLMDLRQVTDLLDYFLLCTGTSPQHVKVLAEEVERQLKLEHQRPLHVEGLKERRWVLLDYVDIAVHIFRRETREFYALERLWGDAPRTVFESLPATDAVPETTSGFEFARNN
mgnify:CR=1 FL=1